MKHVSVSLNPIACPSADWPASSRFSVIYLPGLCVDRKSFQVVSLTETVDHVEKFADPISLIRLGETRLLERCGPFHSSGMESYRADRMCVDAMCEYHFGPEILVIIKDCRVGDSRMT
jgi:hypothetical protein